MTEPIVIESDSVERTLALGAAVGRLCEAGDVVALIGELGAGKTQFVRGMAEGMGIDNRQVSSPTFVIAQEYAGDDQTRVLVHIDAYRLHGGDELSSLGWAGAGGDLPEGAVSVIEWADRVTDALGEDRLEVRIAHAPHGRELTFTPFGRWITRMIPLS